MDKSQQDSFFIDVALPYENVNFRPFADTDADHRLFGDNTYGSHDVIVTPGGRLSRRAPLRSWFLTGSGTDGVLNTSYIERTWSYETLPDSNGTTYRYLLYSVKNTTTGLYSMYYANGTSLTQFTSIRDINASRGPHFVVIAKGKAYVKGFPEAASAEKLGTIIFDGTGGTPTFRPWGLAGPTVTLKMSGWTGFLTADYTDTATLLSVSAVTAPPATPFVMWIGTEILNVTAKAGAGPYTLTVTRGYNGSKAIPHKAKTRVLYRDWAVPTHKVEVKVSWKYTYCYKSITGQYSNTVDLERNPDLNQSETFIFADLIPKMTVQGQADTTNIPSIVIFRSTDGGGTFFELETITNTGAGSITYEDKSYPSDATGSTKNDPVPDKKISTALVAPSLVSNSPPPTVNEPLVVGTDTPTLAFSNMAVFQGRIFFMVGNRLYASASEELKSGNPEESFKIGRNGTYWELTSMGLAVEATSQALYVMTTGATYMLTGSNLESFNLQVISTSTPMDVYDVGASCTFLDRVAFVARGNRACVISGTVVDVISECLTGLPDRGFARQVAYLSDSERQWLCFLCPGSSSAAYSRMYVYDWKRSTEMRRDFWMSPWFCSMTTMCVSTGVGTANFKAYPGDNYLYGAVTYSSGSPVSAGLIFYNPASTLTDRVIVSGQWTNADITFSAVMGPCKNPVGNHVNLHALPQLTTVCTDIKVDYKGSIVGFDGYGYDIGISVFFDTDQIDQLGGNPNNYTYLGAVTKPDRRAYLGAVDALTNAYCTRVAHIYEATCDFFIYLHNGTIPTSYYPNVMRVAVTTAPESGEGQ